MVLSLEPSACTILIIPRPHLFVSISIAKALLQAHTSHLESAVVGLSPSHFLFHLKVLTLNNACRMTAEALYYLGLFQEACGLLMSGPGVKAHPLLG